MPIHQVIKNNCLWEFRVVKVPKDAYKQYIEIQNKYVKFVYQKQKKENIITLKTMDHSLKLLNSYEKQVCHATIEVLMLNLDTNEKQVYNFAVTSKQKLITIKPSLSEYMLGEKSKMYNVIEIKKGLYITSHSINNNWELKSEELRYDEDKDCYIEIATNQPFDITKGDMEKISNILINNIESVKIEDITLSGDFINDIVSCKILEELRKGTFENKSHQEISKEIDKLNDNFIKLEINFWEFLDLKERKPEPFDE